MFEKEVRRDPLFWCGVFVRLALILFVVPKAASEWYVPFLDYSFANFSLDPWSSYLSVGGSYRAFPYGYAMWLPFLPLSGVAKLIGIPAYFGYALTLMLIDLAMLSLLGRFMRVSARTVLVLYWCSPILLFATYWLGLNDLLPVTYLCLGLLCLRNRKALIGGAWLGCAVSAKLSMVAALPLLAFFLWRNRANRVLATPFAKGLAASALLLLTPFGFSAGGLVMLQQNPEMQKIYELSIPLGGESHVYLLGMAYIFMLYVVWRIGRFGFGLLIASLATTFFLFLLLTPAAPGWFVWVLPFLVFLQVQGGRRMIGLVTAFSVAYVLASFLGTSPPDSALLDLGMLGKIKDMVGSHARGVLSTTLTAFGVVLCLRTWREAVRENDFFGLTRRPLVLGIAGDSGAGKDSLVAGLAGLFGTHSVVSISGDDYHFWDRHKPMWQVMTHLNPQANDLEKFSVDLIDLSCRRSILSRHYDHRNGLKSKPFPVHGNDFVIASGLHALYLPALRERYDLSIYLDIDEGLRRYFKLKRDVGVRGHTREKVLAALERRESDSRRFISPQRDRADLVLSLQPIHPHLLDDLDGVREIRTKLLVRAKPGVHETALLRTLVGVCGLHVDMDIASDETYVSMTIEGDVWAEDIALAARQLLPRVEEILDSSPVWEGGMRGVMQLFVLSHLYQARIKKLAW